MLDERDSYCLKTKMRGYRRNLIILSILSSILTILLIWIFRRHQNTSNVADTTSPPVIITTSPVIMTGPLTTNVLIETAVYHNRENDISDFIDIETLVRLIEIPSERSRIHILLKDTGVDPDRLVQLVDDYISLDNSIHSLVMTNTLFHCYTILIINGVLVPQ